MARFFLPPTAWTESAALTGDEAKHLTQVLRKKSGDQITVFDGRGNFTEAIVLNTSKQRVDLMLELAESQVEPQPRITLAQAIPKGKNMDLIVQKAVELGVAEIQPLITENTIVSPDEKKQEKWQRTALEACKQCAQFHLPTVHPPKPFVEWITNKDTTEIDVVASLGDHPRNFRDLLAEKPDLKSITILVGPEGDLSTNEYELAAENSFQAVTLGDLILRVETAALYCLSAVRFQYL